MVAEDATLISCLRYPAWDCFEGQQPDTRLSHLETNPFRLQNNEVPPRCIFLCGFLGRPGSPGLKRRAHFGFRAFSLLVLSFVSCRSQFHFKQK